MIFTDNTPFISLPLTALNANTSDQIVIAEKRRLKDIPHIIITFSFPAPFSCFAAKRDIPYINADISTVAAGINRLSYLLPQRSIFILIS